MSHEKIDGTTEQSFQIGLTGPRLKRVSGVVEARNAIDDDYAIVRGKDPSGDHDFATKLYVDEHSGGGVTQYTPIDANTAIQWKLDELAGAPYVNSGNGGACNLTVISNNAPLPGRSGLFGNAVNFPYGYNWAAWRGTLGSTDGPVKPSSTAMTASVWAKLRTDHKNLDVILAKAYYQGMPWNPPYCSICLSLQSSAQNTAPGALRFIVTTAVTMHEYLAELDTMSFDVWELVAITWDGFRLKSYLNGNLLRDDVVNGTAQPVGIDWGTEGPWLVGGNPPFECFSGSMQDIRVESVVRSTSYLRTMYRKGFCLP
jgi:hypothetical protein